MKLVLKMVFLLSICNGGELVAMESGEFVWFVSGLTPSSDVQAKKIEDASNNINGWIEAYKEKTYKDIPSASFGNYKVIAALLLIHAQSPEKCLEFIKKFTLPEAHACVWQLLHQNSDLTKNNTFLTNKNEERLEKKENQLLVTKSIQSQAETRTVVEHSSKRDNQVQHAYCKFKESTIGKATNTINDWTKSSAAKNFDQLNKPIKDAPVFDAFKDLHDKAYNQSIHYIKKLNQTQAPYSFLISITKFKEIELELKDAKKKNEQILSITDADLLTEGDIGAMIGGDRLVKCTRSLFSRIESLCMFSGFALFVISLIGGGDCNQIPYMSIIQPYAARAVSAVGFLLFLFGAATRYLKNQRAVSIDNARQTIFEKNQVKNIAQYKSMANRSSITVSENLINHSGIQSDYKDYDADNPADILD